MVDLQTKGPGREGHFLFFSKGHFALAEKYLGPFQKLSNKGHLFPPSLAFQN